MRLKEALLAVVNSLLISSVSLYFFSLVWDQNRFSMRMPSSLGNQFSFFEPGRLIAAFFGFSALSILIYWTSTRALGLTFNKMLFCTLTFWVVAVLAYWLVFLTLKKSECPKGIAVFDGYCGYPYGGWPLEFLKFSGGAVGWFRTNYLNLFLDWLFFFVPIFFSVLLAFGLIRKLFHRREQTSNTSE